MATGCCRTRLASVISPRVVLYDILRVLRECEMSPKAMIETGPPGLQDEPPPMPAVVVSPSPSASRQRFISMVMLGAEVAWLLIQTVFMILDAVYHAIKPNDGKDLSGKLVL
ncbi:hypothetical protein FOCC_FOCC004324, partial [Frankliniella occidentalis]